MLMRLEAAGTETLTMRALTPRAAAQTTNRVMMLCRSPRAGFGLAVAGADPRRRCCTNGLAGLSLALFTQMTPPPGSAGGLLNAIVGSLDDDRARRR